MQNKPLTLTLVIAVYNEERHIKACLESVARQSEMPDEVLVIDNNCTDKTIAIAKQFAFVKVISEPKQGLIAARNRGFNAAKTDLVARVDADAVLNPDWVVEAKRSLRSSDMAAVTGLAYTYLFRGIQTKSRFWSWVYFMTREADFNIRILWGANMVMRRSAWAAIKESVCLDDTAVHEDQDMSFLLAARGLRVGRNNRLLITTPGDEYNEFRKFYEYMVRAAKTKRRHRENVKKASERGLTLLPIQRVAMLAVVLVPVLLFTIFSVIHLVVTGGRTSNRYA